MEEERDATVSSGALDDWERNKEIEDITVLVWEHKLIY